MLVYLLLAAALIALLFVGLAFLAKKAPYGWEDEDGFHYGKQGDGK